MTEAQAARVLELLESIYQTLLVLGLEVSFLLFVVIMLIYHKAVAIKKPTSREDK